MDQSRLLFAVAAAVLAFPPAAAAQSRWPAGDEIG